MSGSDLAREIQRLSRSRPQVRTSPHRHLLSVYPSFASSSPSLPPSPLSTSCIVRRCVHCQQVVLGIKGRSSSPCVQFLEPGERLCTEACCRQDVLGLPKVVNNCQILPTCLVLSDSGTRPDQANLLMPSPASDIIYLLGRPHCQK